MELRKYNSSRNIDFPFYRHRQLHDMRSVFITDYRLSFALTPLVTGNRDNLDGSVDVIVRNNVVESRLQIEFCPRTFSHKKQRQPRR